MTSSVAIPEVILGTGTDGNSAAMETPNQLQVILQNLMTGAADLPSINGLKTLVIDSGTIGAAGSIQIGNTETAAEVAANMACLKEIAAFCRANGIVVQVEACLTNPATYTDGTNALVDQWATDAAQAGLPIASVEDVEETEYDQPSSSFADTASIEANAIKTLIADYQGSSYTLNARNLSIGDMESGGASDVPNVSAWISALDAANSKLGLENVSYITADTGWFAPWIDPLSQPTWQSFLEALSSYTSSTNISLDVMVQGPETDVSGSQFVEQSEQLAVSLLQLQAAGSVTVANILAETWQVQPIGDGLISSPDSMVNEAAELTAVAPLFLNGSISAAGTVTTSAPGQIILNAGTVHSVPGLSVQMTLADILAGGRLGVVIIDQTGTLSASQFGSGTVSRLAGNILVLSGDAADLANELASLTVYEQYTGPDTIDMETWGTQGRLSDDQIAVVATAGSIGGTVMSSSSQQGWLSANDMLNTGTVAGSGSVLTSQTLTWSSSGTTAAGSPAFVRTVAIHDPLAEYGVENTQNGIRDVYDPRVDDGVYPSGGWANNPGVNNVSLTNPGWNGNAFNADAELTAFIVTSTVKTFDPVTRRLWTSADTLAPNSPTIIVNGTAVADTFATAFANGGRQITIENTGDNPAWQAGWGAQFSSATLTYDSAGMLVEEFLQGGAGNSAFTIDNIYDPNSGRLWEQFQSTNPPPGSSSGNYANTGDPYQPGFVSGPLYELQEDVPGNPNWDGVDWGNNISTATELWDDYFILAAYQGFALNLPPSSPGDMGSYPLQFVNGTALDLFGLPGSIAVNLNALGSVIIQSQTENSRLSDLTEIDAWGSTGTVTITGLAAGSSTLIGGDNVTTINGYGHDTIVAGAGLTTINSGSGGSTIQVTGASSAINLFGNGNTVSAAGGSTVSETGMGNVIIFQGGGTFQQGVSSSAILDGNGVVAWMSSSGGSVTATGNGDTVTGGSGATITLSGGSDTAGAGLGSTVNITGQGDVVYATGIVINVGASSASPILFGANDTITAVAGNAVTETGAGDVVTFVSGGALKQGASSSAIVNGNNVSITMNATGGAATATGNNDTVTGGTNAAITLSGASDTASAGAGSIVTISGQSGAMSGSGITVVVQSATSAAVTGSNDSVTAVGGSTVTVTGTGESVTFQSAGTLKEGASSSAVVGGNSVTVSMSPSGGSVTANGNGDGVTGGTNAAITISGNNGTASAGTGSTVTLNGQKDAVNGSGLIVIVTSATTATVAGNNDSITAAGGSTISVTGSGESVTFKAAGTFQQGAASSAVINGNNVVGWMYSAGGSVTATGNNDTVTGGQKATITLSGNSDTAGSGVGSTVNVNGQGEVVIGSNMTVAVTAKASVSIFGINDAISAGGSSVVNATGTGEVVMFQSGGTFVLGDGLSAAVVNGDGVVVFMTPTGGSVVATGNSDIVKGGTNALITLSGNGDTSSSVAGSTVNVNGQNEVVNGSAMTVAVAAGASASVSGSNDAINATRGSTVTATGAGNVLTFQYGGTFVLGSASSAAIINGSGVTAWMAATGGSVTATGSGDTVTGGSNATITLSGASDTAGAGVGSTVSVNGVGDVVYGSNIGINVGAGASNLQVFGNNDTITVASGKTISLTGTGETLNGSNLTVCVGANSSGIINGSNDVIAGTASVQAAASVTQTVFVTSAITGGATAYEKLSLSGSNEYVQISNGNSLVVNDTVPASAIAASGLLGAPRQMAFLSVASSSIQATAHPDEFVLLTPTPGASAAFTIAGFDPAQDIIALSAAVFGNAQQILADTQSVSGGASIASLNGSAHVFVAGVTPAHLGAPDFLSI